jgi:hypothetical protein
MMKGPARKLAQVTCGCREAGATPLNGERKERW